MPSALDTPLKGRSIGCTLNRQSDSTKQQREGHNMHGLFQPRLEHKSTVNNKCFDRGADTYSIKVNGTKAALSRLRPQETVGLVLQSASRKSIAIPLHDILTYSNWIRLSKGI